jgi:hypothetical protein
LVVMMDVRYPLALRNVEDLLVERGIDISHETVTGTDILETRSAATRGLCALEPCTRHWELQGVVAHARSLRGDLGRRLSSVPGKCRAQESFLIVPPPTDPRKPPGREQAHTPDPECGSLGEDFARRSAP